MDEAKIRGLKPAFDRKAGTITAGNASIISDGAAAVVVMGSDKASRMEHVKPLARIIGFADAEQEPIHFTTTPQLAIKKVLGRAGMDMADVDYFEINEAFSVVNIANAKLLGMQDDDAFEKMNVFGGSVAMGHPIGCSGTRILVTLLNVLKQKDATIGCAAICNGGGGASALLIERLDA